MYKQIWVQLWDYCNNMSAYEERLESTDWLVKSIYPFADEDRVI